MNIVDAVVKESILGYFDLFPTRAHVLNHMLLGYGTGYEWIERDGYHVLECIHPTNPQTVIPKFEEDNKNFATERDEQHRPFWQANLDYQNIIREWATKNIDVISQAQFKYYGFDPVRQAKPYGSIDYSPMSVHPAFDKIHPDWVEAMREHASDVMYFVRSTTGHQGDDEKLLAWLKGNRSDLHEPAEMCARLIKETNQLDPYLTRNAVALKITKELMAEIKAEEGGGTESTPKARRP